VAKRCLPNKEAFGNVIDFVNNQTITQELTNFTTALAGASYIANAVQDVYDLLLPILISVLVALAISIIWLLLLRCLAGVIVWLTVLLAAGALACLTYVCYQQSEDAWNNHQTIEAYTFGFVSQDLNKKIFKVFFYIFIGLDALFLLILIFMCPRIILSIRIIKVVARIFGNIPALFFFPLVIYFLMLIWWVYCVLVACVLFGAGRPSRVVDVPQDGLEVVDRIVMTYEKTLQAMSIYHFVGFLWVTFFLSALGEMTVAGVVARFYFRKDEEKACLCCKGWICKSFWQAIRYHIGSLAFGSLIITICKVIRAAIEYVDQKTKNKQTTFVKVVIKCMKCCLWCLEKFLKYLNRNAYILIAINGYSFCRGCGSAFQLILRNIIRVATLNWVGDFALFLGRVFVAGVTTAGALWVFPKVKTCRFL
jgi:choline transporter-like protein 2/4/5